MALPLRELEGTWEEVMAHQDELSGHRVRLVVLDPAGEDEQPVLRPRSGRSVLRHAGTWVGDDLDECLQAVYENR